MSQPITTPDQFPSFFRQDTVKQIESHVANHKNIQLISIPGSGKSIMLRYLALQSTPNLNYVYLDLNLVYPKSTSKFIDYILPHIQPFADKKTVILLDSFDQSISPPDNDFFNWLYSIHTQNRSQLNFIFSTDIPLTELNTLHPFGKLSNLLTDAIIHLPPLSNLESDWFVSDTARQIGKSLTQTQKNHLITISGGHMQTLKRLVETMDDPEPNVRLHLHFKQLQDYVSKLNSHQLTLAIPAFNDYISTTNRSTDPNELFTPNEKKVYDLLQSKLNSMVDRSTIIEHIWGNSADTTISDHALDQLIHRLKSKLNPSNLPEKIITVRARGHKLVIK